MSQHIFEKCGFKREGILRELIYKKGKFEDAYEYGIIKSDWVSMVTNSSKY